MVNRVPQDLYDDWSEDDDEERHPPMPVERHVFTYRIRIRMGGRLREYPVTGTLTLHDEHQLDEEVAIKPQLRFATGEAAGTNLPVVDIVDLPGVLYVTPRILLAGEVSITYDLDTAAK